MLLISGRKITVLRNCPANNTVKTVYKISGYSNRTHGAVDNNYISFTATENTHPSLDGSSESIFSAFLFLREKYHEIEKVKVGDLRYSFLMSAKANFYCEFCKIAISSHGPSSRVRWCYPHLCTKYWNQNARRQTCHTKCKGLRISWTLLDMQQAQVLGSDYIGAYPEPPAARHRGWLQPVCATPIAVE